MTESKIYEFPDDVGGPLIALNEAIVAFRKGKVNNLILIYTVETDNPEVPKVHKYWCCKKSVLWLRGLMRRADDFMRNWWELGQDFHYHDY